MLERSGFLLFFLVAIGCGAEVEGSSSSSNTAGTTSSSAVSSSSTSGVGGSTTTASTASTGGTGGAGGSGGGPGATIVLDPATLTYFELPIGSLRYAVAGQDQASNTCVTLVWWGNTGPMCAMPNMQNWPYVVITPNAQAPCMQWAYAGNVNVDDAMGCVEFTPGQTLTAAVDVTLEVSGGLFTGTIVADNVP